MLSGNAAPLFARLAFPGRRSRVAPYRRVDLLRLLGRPQPTLDLGELLLVLGSFDQDLQLLLQVRGRLQTVASVRVDVQGTLGDGVEEQQNAGDYVFLLVDAGDGVVGDEVLDRLVLGLGGLVRLGHDVLDYLQALVGHLKRPSRSLREGGGVEENAITCRVTLNGSTSFSLSVRCPMTGRTNSEPRSPFDSFAPKNHT